MYFQSFIIFLNFRFRNLSLSSPSDSKEKFLNSQTTRRDVTMSLGIHFSFFSSLFPSTSSVPCVRMSENVMRNFMHRHWAMPVTSALWNIQIRSVGIRHLIYGSSICAYAGHKSTVYGNWKLIIVPLYRHVVLIKILNSPFLRKFH